MDAERRAPSHTGEETKMLDTGRYNERGPQENQFDVLPEIDDGLRLVGWAVIEREAELAKLRARLEKLERLYETARYWVYLERVSPRASQRDRELALAEVDATFVQDFGEPM